jgi:hypothetical protein
MLQAYVFTGHDRALTTARPKRNKKGAALAAPFRHCWISENDQ